MKRLLYIERFVLATVLLMLLALAPAMAQPVVHTGETTTVGVEERFGDTYEWELYDNGLVDFAKVLGNCPVESATFVTGNIGASVDIKWLKAGIYFFKVTALDAAGCAMNFKIGMVEVKLAVKAEITPPDTAGVCLDKPVVLEVNLTGNAPWNFICTDGVNSWPVNNVMTTPYLLTIDPTPPTTTKYWISTVSDLYGTNTEPSDTVTQKINPLPDPSNIIHR